MDKVHVAVRIRPFSQKEHHEGGKNIVDISGSQVGLLPVSENQSPLRFAFDNVLPPEASQTQVFDDLALPLLNKTFEGYNCTMFAYGQTGAGKTYTILNQNAGDERGIVPRISEELFARIDAIHTESPHRKFLVGFSVLEIYNEILYDLLVPRKSKTSTSTGLEIHEQKGVGVYVKDLTEIVVDSCSKLCELMEQGLESRVTAATKMNQASSRSHCILTIKLYQKDENDSSKNTFASMNLVDLAGSERSQEAGVEAKVLREGANINKSLSALGNVIKALASQTTGQSKVFVPYRNSKLTRVLQDALGGNSFCSMLANISPASVNYEETLSTLNYAKRAKLIRVKAVKNDETANIAKLNDEVENLREKLEHQTAQIVDTQIDNVAAERRELQQKYDRQIEELQGLIKQTWQDKENVSAQHEMERKRLMEEARQRDEELVNQRRLRLKILEEKGDLMVSIGEVQALDSELLGGWADCIRQAKSRDQQLRSQFQAVQLCRDSAKQDLGYWWEKREDTLAAHYLQQVAMKLLSMLRELATLVSLENDISDLLTTAVPKVQKAATCCKDGEEVTEVLGIVIRQLDAYRLEIHRFLLNARKDLTMEEEIPRLREALGEDVILSPLEDVMEVLPMPLGVSSFSIEDKCMTASSNSFASDCGRLLLEAGPYGGWCARTDDVGEYLEIDIGEESYISAISTQGRVPATGGWQQTRELLKQVLGEEVLPSGEAMPSSDRVYIRPPVRFMHDVTTALIQRYGIFSAVFTDEQLVYARLTSKDARLAFFRDLIDAVRPFQALDLTAQDIISGKNTTESGRLLQILAYISIEQVGNLETCRGAPGGSKGACRGPAGSLQGAWREPVGGLADVSVQWTTQYTLEWSSGAEWLPVCAEDGTEVVCEGNLDASSVKSCSFLPVRAKRLRICPVSWHKHPALRVELYGSKNGLPARACCGLEKRLRQVTSIIDMLKERAEERQRAALQAEEAERDKKASQAMQAEQEHSEMQKRLQEALTDLEELRGRLAATEERAIEAETGRLQMQLERDRAQASVEQLQADLSKGAEIQRASEQALVTLRRDSDDLRERILDMEQQIQVLTEERDSAYLREEDIFEQMLAMEAIVNTTEAYLTDKLLEKEAEVERLSPSPLPCKASIEKTRVTMDADEYEDDFDAESDDGSIRRTPTQMRSYTSEFYTAGSRPGGSVERSNSA